MSLLRVGFASLALLSLSSSFVSSCPQHVPHPPSSLVSVPVYTRAELSGPSSKIRTNVGGSFLIELSSNPTTGYSWQVSEGYTLEDNSPGLTVSGCEYIKSGGGKKMVGGGGIERWLFTAKEAGEQLIPLQYARPWEKDNNYNAEPDLVVTVEVAGSAEESVEETLEEFFN